MFLVVKTKKKIQSMCQKYFQKICWFIIDKRKGQKALFSYQRFQYIHTFMYEHILHRGRRFFCRYYLQAFSKAEKFMLMIALELITNKWLRCLKKVIFTFFRKNCNLRLMQILKVQEDNTKQYPDEFYTKKY